MFNRITFLMIAVLALGCQSDETSTEQDAPQPKKNTLNSILSIENQKKVYSELRLADKRGGAEALAAFPKSGIEGGGADEFRLLQDSLKRTYWTEVCLKHGIEPSFGDSIWRKGTQEQWTFEVN